MLWIILAFFMKKWPHYGFVELCGFHRLGTVHEFLEFWRSMGFLRN